MNQRPLGRTARQVSAMGLGTWQLGADWGAVSEEDATAKYGPDIQNPKRMGRGDEYARLAMAMIDNDYLNGEVVRIDGALRFPATPPKA